MNIGKEIALQAKKHGICNEWFREMLRQNSIKPLCEMYFRGDDWAMEHDFPNVEIMRQFKGNSDQFGMFTDFSGEIENRHEAAIFGNSNVICVYNGFFAGKLILRHESKANVKVSGNAFLVVEVLDKAQVEIEAKGRSNVKVFYYGNETTGLFTGNVEVIQKKWHV